MKRISVTIYTRQTGYCAAEVTKVEAYCKKCCAWKPDTRVSFKDFGYCCRFPATVRKHENDWCGEFKPELKECESEE
jgi:hypothetical protein